MYRENCRNNYYYIVILMQYNYMLYINYMLFNLSGSIKNKIKLNSLRGNRGKSKDGMISIRCLAISTDGKFLVSIFIK